MEIFSGKCRKHPSSNKQPGICSACLRDRLLQLADAYNHNTTLFYSNTADCCSVATSTSSSPVYFSNLMTDKSADGRGVKHVRNASDMVRSISYVIGRGGELKKSRSIAATTMDEVKRGSFWKKLLRIREKRRTLKDRFDE